MQPGWEIIGFSWGRMNLPPTPDHIRAHGSFRAILCLRPGLVHLFCPMTLESRDSSLLWMAISERLVLAPRLFRHRNLSGKAVCSQELSPGKDTET